MRLIYLVSTKQDPLNTKNKKYFKIICLQTTQELREAKMKLCTGWRTKRGTKIKTQFFLIRILFYF